MKGEIRRFIARDGSTVWQVSIAESLEGRVTFDVPDAMAARVLLVALAKAETMTIEFGSEDL